MNNSKTESLRTPVLFLVFNRPDHTRQVLEAIRGVRPSRLYIAADGPRASEQQEVLLCEETRRVAQQINWPCKVETLFRSENLGCRAAVSSAIDWFFQNEGAGIILEDDCLPSTSFFYFCENLLERYANDTRINSIAGNNFQSDKYASSYSYYFSHYNHVWGWATWRRSWRKFDHDMSHWERFRDSGGLTSIGRTPAFEKYWKNILDDVASRKIDSWAYVWTFSAWCQNQLSCIPEKNLVRNLGFGKVSTHTSDAQSPLAKLENHELEFPLRHPEFITRNTAADSVTDRRVYNISAVSVFMRAMREKYGFSPLRVYWQKLRRIVNISR